jgi:hypothetical protein
MKEQTRKQLTLAACLAAGALLAWLTKSWSPILFASLIGLAATGSLGKGVSLTKQTRRAVTAAVFSCMLLLGLTLGYMTGDYVSGVVGAFALSFVIILKAERLFDERVGVVLAKAGRDGFVAGNILVNLHFMLGGIIGDLPLISAWTTRGQLAAAVCFTWVVFLASAAYHAFVKGE